MDHAQLHRIHAQNALTQRLGIRFFPYIVDDFLIYEQQLGSQADTMLVSDLVKEYVDESDHQDTLLTEDDVFKLMYYRSEYNMSEHLLAIEANELLCEKLGMNIFHTKPAVEVALTIVSLCKTLEKDGVTEFEPDILQRWEYFKVTKVTTCEECRGPIFFDGKQEDLAERACIVMYGAEEKHFCSPKHAARYLKQEVLGE